MREISYLNRRKPFPPNLYMAYVVMPYSMMVGLKSLTYVLSINDKGGTYIMQVE